MISELALVAQLRTSPIKRSNTQTIPNESSIFIGVVSVGDIDNHTQTIAYPYDKLSSAQITYLDLFNNMKDLDENEMESYKNLLNQKKKVIQKSFL